MANVKDAAGVKDALTVEWSDFPEVDCERYAGQIVVVDLSGDFLLAAPNRKAAVDELTADQRQAGFKFIEFPSRDAD